MLFKFIPKCYTHNSIKIYTTYYIYTYVYTPFNYKTCVLICVVLILVSQTMHKCVSQSKTRNLRSFKPFYGSVLSKIPISISNMHVLQCFQKAFSYKCTAIYCIVFISIEHTSGSKLHIIIVKGGLISNIRKCHLQFISCFETTFSEVSEC